ncbi:acyl-CoA thioesterase [Cobetia sp. 5-11-6-3]
MSEQTATSEKNAMNQPAETPMPSATVEMEVPFHDVDMMEVAWHGHYVRYLEIARCKLLDMLDYNYPQMRESGYAWPVIDLRLRYAGPARFGQRIAVTARLREWENRLKLDYVIRDVESGKRLTRGHSVQVAVGLADGEMLLASPPALSERLAAWQASQSQTSPSQTADKDAPATPPPTRGTP